MSCALEASWQHLAVLGFSMSGARKRHFIFDRSLFLTESICHVFREPRKHPSQAPQNGWLPVQKTQGSSSHGCFPSPIGCSHVSGLALRYPLDSASESLLKELSLKETDDCNFTLKAWLHIGLNQPSPGSQVWYIVFFATNPLAKLV